MTGIGEPQITDDGRIGEIFVDEVREQTIETASIDFEFHRKDGDLDVYALDIELHDGNIRARLTEEEALELADRIYGRTA